MNNLVYESLFALTRCALHARDHKRDIRTRNPQRRSTYPTATNKINLEAIQASQILPKYFQFVKAVDDAPLVQAIKMISLRWPYPCPLHMQDRLILETLTLIFILLL